MISVKEKHKKSLETFSSVKSLDLFFRGHSVLELMIVKGTSGWRNLDWTDSQYTAPNRLTRPVKVVTVIHNLHYLFSGLV